MPVILELCPSSPVISTPSQSRKLAQLGSLKFPAPLITCIIPLHSNELSKTLTCSHSCPIWRTSHLSFFGNRVFADASYIHFPERSENGKIAKTDELELLNKSSTAPIPNRHPSQTVDAESEEPLAPFLELFKARDSAEEANYDDIDSEKAMEQHRDKFQTQVDESKKISVEYYQPKPGDSVVGVVVSGSEDKLHIDLGADLLGTMLTKEVLPLYDKEMEYLLCDPQGCKGRGEMGIVKNDDAIFGRPVPGSPVVETGTVLFAEVVCRTLSGRPLLSTRRFVRRIAWHRLRQIKQLNEPIKVKITEWNPNGLLTRIEGLRAFIPKSELMGRINNFTELKEHVSQQMCVLINRIDEAKSVLILSEKEAWEITHLQEGVLLEGTVSKIFPYGALIRIGETKRSGLLHISKISKARVSSVSEVLAINEKVKVMVKSMYSNKISLSIADLESEPGIFLTNKERVSSEAEEMAKRYREKLPPVPAARKLEPMLGTVAFAEETNLCANWKWLKFERTNEPQHSLIRMPA